MLKQISVVLLALAGLTACAGGTNTGNLASGNMQVAPPVLPPDGRPPFQDGWRPEGRQFPACVSTHPDLPGLIHSVGYHTNFVTLQAAIDAGLSFVSKRALPDVSLSVEEFTADGKTYYLIVNEAGETKGTLDILHPTQTSLWTLAEVNVCTDVSIEIGTEPERPGVSAEDTQETS